MEIFLASLVAKVVLKALVSGEAVSRADMAGAVTAVFDGLTASRPERLAELHRIEANTGWLIDHAFNERYQAGLSAVSDAGSSERTPAQQDAKLERAREHFLGAAVAAQSPESKATALRGAGLSSMLARRPREALETLSHSWAQAYSAMADALKRAETPLPRDDSVRTWVAGVLAGNQDNPEERVRNARSPEIDRLRAILPIAEDVQGLRAILGAPDAELAGPQEWWQPPLWTSQSLHVVLVATGDRVVLPDRSSFVVQIDSRDPAVVTVTASSPNSERVDVRGVWDQPPITAAFTRSSRRGPSPQRGADLTIASADGAPTTFALPAPSALLMEGLNKRPRRLEIVYRGFLVTFSLFDR